MKRSFLFLSLFVLLFSFNGTSRLTRVLFIGNSYTYSGDLPNTFLELAKSGGHRVEVGMAAQAGWKLSDHVESPKTLETLNSKKWDFVVLQEQSRIPAEKQTRTEEMYPAARTLVSEIRDVGATPLFFITWGRRNAWPGFVLLGYKIMQSEVNEGYMAIAEELDAPVAPVGAAWRSAATKHPELNLWQEDGSHPDKDGTYLAACVFYAVIFNESPEGLTYYAELSEEVANTLQTIASTTVLK
jgi:hypothetical protein